MNIVQSQAQTDRLYTNAHRSFDVYGTRKFKALVEIASFNLTGRLYVRAIEFD